MLTIRDELINSEQHQDTPILHYFMELLKYDNITPENIDNFFLDLQKGVWNE